MILKNWKLTAAGIAIAAALAATWGWRAEIQSAAQAIEQANTLRDSLKASNARIDEMSDEIDRREHLVKQRRENERELERELASARQKLQRGIENDESEYAECRDVELPRDVRDGLLDYAGNNTD